MTDSNNQRDHLIGQWLGSIEGTNKGTVILNIESKNDDKSYSAHFLFSESNPELYSLYGSGSITLDSINNSIEANFKNCSPINKEGQITDQPKVNNISPNATLPSSVTIRGKLFDDKTRIEGNWITDVSTEGKCYLFSGESISHSISENPITEWGEFKKVIEQSYLGKTGFVFRGQSNSSWRLRTSFHRTGQYNLKRYQEQHLEELYRAIESQLELEYNLSISKEYGAFLHLIQHHGYPTPLLDWTNSPYIAAFFAFEELQKQDQKVKIFVFDYIKWSNRETSNSLYSDTALTDPKPTITFKLLSAQKNPRSIRQQALSCFSNIQNIEGFISLIQHDKKTDYLTCYELPGSEKKKALDDLRLMGITRSSLFPDLDGVCRDFKAQHFCL